MKAIQLDAKGILKNHQYLLLVLAASLVAIHISIIWKTNDSNFFGGSVVFLAAISSSIWEKRDNLNLESGILPSFLGLLLITIVFLNSLFAVNSGIPLAISLFTSALSLALLASGFKGLKEFRLELLALFFLTASKVLIPFIFDISLLTANFTATILWLIGYEVVLHGYKIILPNSSVEVFAFCSGMDLILQMLGLAALFFLTFPLDWKWGHKIIVPIVAATLGFIVNGIRAVMMAILVEQRQNVGFKYWHEGDGSLIFSTISVGLFCCFCWFLLWMYKVKNRDALES